MKNNTVNGQDDGFWNGGKGGCGTPASMAGRRVLVAGIGNVFLGDDGFGVEVVQRLAGVPLPEGTDVHDFGVRRTDLAYALVDGYDAAILVDAVARGGAPGSLYLIEPNTAAGDTVPLEYTETAPLAVLGLARLLGVLPPRLLIVGCEPAAGALEALSMEMTPQVAAQVEPAARMVVDLAGKLAFGAGLTAQWSYWTPARWR